MQAGDRMLVPCEGGPSQSRLVRFPPPLEVPERGGCSVLVDEGPVVSWSYLWVPDERT